MGTGALEAACDRSLTWREAAEAVSWHKKWTKVLDDGHPPFYRWFVGGECNTAAMVEQTSGPDGSLRCASVRQIPSRLWGI